MKHFSLDKNTTSLEAVDRQDKSFFSDLVEAFADIRMRAKVTDKELPSFYGIESIVKRYTNITLNIIPTTFEKKIKDAFKAIYIEIDTINKNHIYVDNITKIMSESLAGMYYPDNYKVMGTISLSKNHVTGHYADIISDMYIPISIFKYDYFNDREMAAVFLHEVGHLFTTYEAMDKMVAANQVLSSLLGKLNKTDNLKERTTVLEKAYRGLKRHAKAEVIQHQAMQDNDTAMRLFITHQTIYTKSMQNSFWYDLTMSEQAADQYAVRMGAGSYLAQALEKIDRTLGANVFQKTRGEFEQVELIRKNKLFWGKTLKRASTFAKIAAVVSLLLGHGLGIAATWTLASMIHSWISNAIFTRLGRDAGLVDPTYDRPRVRILRIKEDLVNQLKETDKSSEYYKAVLSDIREVEEVLKNYYHEESFIVKILDFGNRIDGTRMDEETIQRELESLAANDLFIHAHQFKNA